MDASFFDEVNEVIQDEPSEAGDPEILGLLAAIGIEKGKAFAPDARMKKILAEAAAVGQATVRALAYRCRLKEAFFYPNSAWNTPFVGGSSEFLHQGARLLDARSYFFFYATGITPAMRFSASAPDPRTPPRSWTRSSVPSMAPRPTGCTCQPASPPSSSGRWCSTTRRRARCCRPTSRSPASAARRKAWRSIPTRQWTSTSGRRHPQARRATGYRRGPAKGGRSSFASTARYSRSSTGRGGPAKSKTAIATTR